MQKWPADRVERRSLASLVPYARNARTHDAAQVSQIAASIREWGWTTPVLIDEAGGIIAGHGRVLAALQLGLAEVPCVVAVGWTEAQRRAYVIADNKLALNAGWNDEMLKVEFGDLSLAGFDLSLTGFSDGELDKALAWEPEDASPPPDAIPEPPHDPVSRTGDLWLLSDHRLLCGDSTAALGRAAP